MDNELSPACCIFAEHLGDAGGGSLRRAARTSQSHTRVGIGVRSRPESSRLGPGPWTWPGPTQTGLSPGRRSSRLWATDSENWGPPKPWVECRQAGKLTFSRLERLKVALYKRRDDNASFTKPVVFHSLHQCPPGGAGQELVSGMPVGPPAPQVS